MVNLQKTPQIPNLYACYTSHYPKDVPFEVPEGWAWCKIEEIAESNIGLTYKPEDVCSDGIPVLRSNNIKNRRICTDGLIRVKTHILPKQFIGKGDLLICARNGSRNLVGKCALIEQDEEPMSFGAFMAVCRSAFNRWIFLILNSSYFNQYLDNSNSTAINQVTQSMLLSFNIPLPPKNEQARINSMVERLCSCVDELEKHEQVVLAKINDSRKRILELAIHGKLVPQDPTEEPAIELLKRINPAFEPSHNLHYEGDLPQGWSLCRLEEVLDYEQPQAYIVKSTDYSDEYSTPVLTPGKSFILGYTNEIDGVCDTLPVIIFDDFTTESKYVDFPFKVKSSALKILRPKREIDIRYVAFYMIITRLAGNTHKRYWISEYSKLSIPIPPIEEQHRIVRKIDCFYKALSDIGDLIKKE